MKPTWRPCVRFVTETRMFNAQFPQKWGSTIKSAVSGSISSLPLPFYWGCELVSESVGKADLLSDLFDSKQSRESVDLPLTCQPPPILITI